ncbi:uncharacterized protein BX664DRAFT_341893 [Halteromyces radiatus]|uniref:uncharacterized protein n=1 Tax=Halteromyces radiatus TaxID=101107 RepID=UPI00221F4EA8|nr:uncharacterized protein BX664DRAFT_341893 [Halteromyces radiatus]KAI8079956.1 hypothetical protein BX664DRAFT_341893 [Halteromyces radiatus]
MYRTFLKAADKALPRTLQKTWYLRQRIRRQFEAYKKETDPIKRLEWESRAKNTLLLVQLASQRRGLENDIIKNLAELEYHRTKFNERSPLAYHKIRPEVQQLHQNADKDLEIVIDKLNKELNLCL